MKDYSVIIENLMDGIITNLEEAYDYGYHQGYEDGKKASCDCKDNMEAEYNRGLNEAWEVAKKLVHPVNGGYTDAVKKKIFEYLTSDSILLTYTASEAIAKIKEYEEQQKQDTEQEQDTIKVGDEVFYMDENDLRVVVRISNQMDVVQITKDGKCAINDVKELHKTGRTFPQIAEVFEEMRGEE